MLIPALVAGLLTACATPGLGTPEASEESAAASRPAFETVSPEPKESGLVGRGDGPSEVPDEVWQSILDDLADRFGEVGEVEVISARAVTWNDGSLGCPEPGMMYTQALVDGYHVIVEVDGEELDYRAVESGGARLCEDPSGT